MRSQDDPGRGRRHPADGLQLLLAGIRARQVVDDGTQVLQVQQGQPLGVGPVEDQLEGRGLSVVEAQDAGEQDRPELGDVCLAFIYVQLNPEFHEAVRLPQPAAAGGGGGDDLDDDLDD